MGIFNPAGNTDPSNAYATFYAPVLDETNENWGGILRGSVAFGTADTDINTQQDSSDATNHFLITESFNIFGNSTFGLIFNTDDTVYLDTLIIARGDWNATNSNFDYSYQYLNLPMVKDVDSSGTALSATLEFGVTGANGFLAAIGGAPSPVYGTFNPTVFKTADGGSSWSAPQVIYIDSLVVIDSNKTLLQITQDWLNPAGWTINAMTALSEMDMTVDINGNPHILMNVFPGSTSSSPSATADPFTFFPGANTIVDVYSTDGGTTWNAKYVTNPTNWDGPFGAVTSNNRPQVSRNADGSMIFYHWFETDNSLWGGTDNAQPDLMMQGLNVSTDKFITAGPYNMTINDPNLIGQMSFGNVAAQAWDAGNGLYTSHVVIQHLDPNTLSDTDPTTYEYYPAVFGATVSVEEESLNAFELGQNFPNPASDITRVGMNVVKTGNYSVEVSNMLGKVVMTKDLGKLTQGQNTFAIDASSFKSGVYFYTVKSGNLAQTKKMIVK